MGKTKSEPESSKDSEENLQERQKENQKGVRLNRINITYGILYIIIPSAAHLIWGAKEGITIAVLLWILIQIATSTEEWHERTGL